MSANAGLGFPSDETRARSAGRLTGAPGRRNVVGSMSEPRHEMHAQIAAGLVRDDERDSAPSAGLREFSRLSGMIDGLEALIDTLEGGIAGVLRNEVLEPGPVEPSVAAIQNLSAFTEMIQVAGDRVQYLSQRVARIIDRVDV